MGIDTQGYCLEESNPPPTLSQLQLSREKATTRAALLPEGWCRTWGNFFIVFAFYLPVGGVGEDEKISAALWLECKKSVR